MNKKILLLACIFLIQQVVSGLSEEYEEDNEELGTFFISSDVRSWTEEEAEEQDDDTEFSDFFTDNAADFLKNIDEDTFIVLRGIEVLSSEMIPSNAVNVDLALRSLNFNTTFDKIYFRGSYLSFSENDELGSGQVSSTLYNVTASGIASFSESQTIPSITNLFTNYRTDFLEISSQGEGNEEHSTPQTVQIQELPDELKPSFDSFLTTQLNGILQERYTSNDLPVRSLPIPYSKLNTSADKIVDQMLASLSKNVENRIAIPDISAKFKRGYIKTSNGWFEELATIRRTSNITLSEQGGRYIVSASFGIRQAKIGFNYKAKYSFVKVKGKAVGKVGYNSIAIQLLLDTRNGKCSVGLSKLKVEQLKNIQVKLTGFGAFNKIVSKIASKQINKRKGKLIAKLQSKLDDYVRKYLKTYDCSKIMGM